jgi:hypothetical protein
MKTPRPRYECPNCDKHFRGEACPACGFVPPGDAGLDGYRAAPALPEYAIHEWTVEEKIEAEARYRMLAVILHEKPWYEVRNAAPPPKGTNERRLQRAADEALRRYRAGEEDWFGHIPPAPGGHPALVALDATRSRWLMARVVSSETAR